MTLNNTLTKKPAPNRRMAQWRLTWLIEHSTSHQHLWCIDSLEASGCAPKSRTNAKPQNVMYQATNDCNYNKRTDNDR